VAAVIRSSQATATSSHSSTQVNKLRTYAVNLQAAFPRLHPISYCKRFMLSNALAKIRWAKTEYKFGVLESCYWEKLQWLYTQHEHWNYSD